MDAFESRLSRATSPSAREILGALVSVVDRHGTVIYNFASGRQYLDDDAPMIEPKSTLELGSAGKFITHIAALQCVERGLIFLDEPVYSHLPELKEVEIIAKNDTPDNSGRTFSLRPAQNKITLRHLLAHSSGIGSSSHPLIQQWRKTTEPKPENPDQHIIARLFSMPLLFEPSEGWMYGASIAWTELLVSRLTNQTLPQYVQENIFAPLEMNCSTYGPRSRPDISSKALKMVERIGDQLTPVDEEVKGLMSNISDLTVLLAELISPSPRILKEESVKLLFEPQLKGSSAALTDLRRNTETYAAPAGIPSTMTDPPVNYSLSGLLVEQELPLSHIPAGTALWSGMPNVIWAMNRERGLGMLFATQLLPVDDPITVDLAMDFFKSAWEHFG